MYALKNITFSYSKYNVLLYLYTKTCYFNKTPLFGGITLSFLNIFVMQYMEPSSSFFHKGNTVMFPIINTTIKLLKEFPHTNFINTCYSREMCVTRVIFSVIGGNNLEQYMEIYILNKKHIY